MTCRVIAFLTRLSLAAPFIAVLVCYIVRRGFIGWLWPDTFEFRQIQLAWHYTFLVSGSIGLLALGSSLIIKEKRLVWMSVASLALSLLFAKLTVIWTYLK